MKAEWRNYKRNDDLMELLGYELWVRMRQRTMNKRSFEVLRK